MSRSQALIESAVSAFQSATPATIYQWVQQLDSEYSRHRYPELLVHHLPDYQLDKSSARAIVAAVDAMKLAIQLQLHTHSRRVLAAAVICRALNDSLSKWQDLGLKQPLWCAAFKSQQVNSTSDSYYFCQWVLCLADARLDADVEGISELLTGPYRFRYWLFARQLNSPPTMATGALLENTTSGQQRYLLTTEADGWLTFDAQRQKLTRITANECQNWQLADIKPNNDILKQLDYIRALNQNLPSVSFKAPKPLLSAIKRYTSGSGALAPVIRHIQQRPLLAESIRLAAAQENLQANDPWRMDLKHLYLWLGGTKASVVLATASLQQQFMQQRVPLQQSLMQRLNVLTELLSALSRASKTPLPTPAPLLTLLTAADLFREPSLLRASHWPDVKQINSLTKHSWLGLSDNTKTTVGEQRLARQLIARWQLEKQLHMLVDGNSNHPLVALMGICNLLVLRVFHPNAAFSNQTKQQFSAAMTRLKLDSSSVDRALAEATAKSLPYCPLTELSASR